MTGHNIKIAVSYQRVSSIKQSTVGTGLESQRTRCLEFARMKHYKVIKSFEDDVSGSLTERPGMKAMLAFIRKQKGGVVVIIDDVSRLARGLQAHLELRGAIARAGGVLESPSIEFGEDSDSVLVENLLASVSQHQRQKNGEQTRNRMRSRVQNGFWPFRAPFGYRHMRQSGRGLVLTPHEPVASIVKEALEGFATRHFETQADVQRFLQAEPLFPKDAHGIVRHQRVMQLLRSPLYAGLVEAKEWDIGVRSGQHEPLISLQTHKRILDRLNGGVYAPRRKNLNEDFPLRGYVLCADCQTSLTSCWAKGTHKLFPYYHCPRKGCPSYGKSIRREKIESEFETLLASVQPTETVATVATAMFRDLWNHRLSHGEGQKKNLAAQLLKIEKQVSQFLERIVDATVPSVISAYEDRVRKLEEEKLLIKEKMAGVGRPKNSFDDTLRTALAFLSSPWNLWRSESLEDRQTVLKLTFAEKLRYSRNEGFRTTKLSLPFKVLDQFCGGKNEMARPTG